MYEYFELLVHIAEKSSLFNRLETSTLKLSKELNISQQTMSRKLRDMETQGLIIRQASPNGLIISIDEKGRNFLKNNFNQLSSIFNLKTSQIIGSVQDGIGEGSYYVSQKQYQNQFREKIGFIAYPGTLNLKINKEEFNQFLLNKDKVIIDGFSTKTRTFGSLTAYKIKITNIEAAIVVPERTRHEKDIIEIIASVNLRETLKLKENSKIKLS